ncbi:MFS transporter [Bifidobacterium bifidum]|uniref:MFS transporter n=1 Tax=Bifidobacterium bifidum TaxID=1681 RepID=UPI000E4FBABF|nr:MFS transporter [Bifidobacterium bifidum]RGJ39168.1 MFS transporter [Bifidobacterium bifidum]RGJ56952.1 MFS transporter [Bifidobacterium bifidum]
MARFTENRWTSAIIPALLIHIPIGTVYCWSVFKQLIADRLNASPASVEWGFSLAIFFLGMSAAFAGPMVEKNIKKSALVSMVCFVVGFAGTGVSIALNFLPGVFICYGAIMGIGLGVGYLTPVKNLMLWFSDNKGLATGIAVAGFGLVLAVDSVFNTAGRVGFSTLSDHLKRRETVYQVIFIMSIAVCLLQIFTNSINNALLWAVLAMLFLINAGYGGGFSTLPVLLDQHFGTKTVSTTHGLALSAWAFAGLSGNQLASFVVTHTPDQAHRYAALIPVLTGLFALALISISLVKYLGGRNGEGKRSIGA